MPEPRKPRHPLGHPKHPLWDLADIVAEEAPKALREGFSLGDPEAIFEPSPLVRCEVSRMAGDIKAVMPFHVTLVEMQVNTPQELADLIRLRMENAQLTIGSIGPRKREVRP